MAAGKTRPLYPAWNEALERLIEAERRFYTALMEERLSEEVQVAAHDLDEARTKYRKISDAIGWAIASSPEIQIRQTRRATLPPTPRSAKCNHHDKPKAYRRLRTAGAAQ